MKSKRSRAERDDDDQSFTHINKYELEEEWVGQADLAKEWNEKLAEANLRVDEAEDAFEIIKAEIAKEIRDDPESFGIDKVTEPAIKEAIPLQSRYEKARKKIRNAKYEAGIIKAATIAVEHRKRGLEKLVDLFMAGYFAVPRASDQGKEFADQSEKRSARSRAIKSR